MDHHKNNNTEPGIPVQGGRGGPPPDALLEDLYRHHKDTLVRMLRRHAPSLDAAENLFHEACRITAERLRNHTITDPSRLAGFVYGTARRVALAQRRQFATSRTEVMPDLPESIPDDQPPPEAATEREQLAACVQRLLEELPVERDRRVLVRLYLDERDKDEICAELGLTDEHFSRVLFRAKLRFRAILERHGLDSLRRMIGLLLLAPLVGILRQG